MDQCTGDEGARLCPLYSCRLIGKGFGNGVIYTDSTATLDLHRALDLYIHP